MKAFTVVNSASCLRVVISNQSSYSVLHSNAVLRAGTLPGLKLADNQTCIPSMQNLVLSNF